MSFTKFHGDSEDETTEADNIFLRQLLAVSYGMGLENVFHHTVQALDETGSVTVLPISLGCEAKTADG